MVLSLVKQDVVDLLVQVFALEQAGIGDLKSSGRLWKLGISILKASPGDLKRTLRRTAGGSARYLRGTFWLTVKEDKCLSGLQTSLVH